MKEEAAFPGAAPKPQQQKNDKQKYPG